MEGAVGAAKQVLKSLEGFRSTKTQQCSSDASTYFPGEWTRYFDRSARVFVIFGNSLNATKPSWWTRMLSLAACIKHSVRGIVLHKRILRSRAREALHQLHSVGANLDLAFVGAEALALEVLLSSYNRILS
jgi:hypothetical protein